jgi:transcriptional regulator with XRE-family HTH domain
VLGQRIRAARKAKRLSQEDLALEADIAVDYAGGIERGQRNPSFRILCALARTLGCDMGSLCRDLPRPQEEPYKGSSTGGNRAFQPRMDTDGHGF